jgi:hypothetical protein
MLIAVVALFVIDGVLRHVFGNFSDVRLGLLIAFVLYGALFMLASRLIHHPHGIFAAVVASFIFIILVPVIYMLFTHSDGPPIRDKAQIPGRIDLVIISPGVRHEHGSRPSVPPADLAAWDLRYTVAVPAPGHKGLEILVAGTDSRSLALRALRTGRALEPGGRQVQWRAGAQRAVVLDVDQGPISVFGSGTGQPAIGRRFSATASRADNPLVAAASSLRAPDFVLLTGASPRRLKRWNEWAQAHGGEAGIASDIEGPTLLDASLRLVAQSRSSLADRQLAYAYRPLLFFDKRELYAWPVDVDAAFAEGDVKMCKHVLTGDDCKEVTRAANLDQSFDYLRFDPGRFDAQEREQSPQAVGSTYYYHVVHGKSKPNTYIDYWWYLPYNPSISSWMCAPGFNVTDLDCFDHESDWEGVTVEVGAEGKPPPFVYYAQHSHVVRFSWGELEKSWRKLPQEQLVDAHGAHHPLVFVARDSHAAYRVPCSDSVCFEQSSVLPEGKHSGEGKWSGDDDEVCAGLCLKPLPVTRAGRPATWNAFSGPWGTQTCVLWGTFCDRGEAPHSPSFQWRYEHPGTVH